VRLKRFAKARLGQALVRGGLWQHRLHKCARHNAVPEKWNETPATAGYRTVCLARPVTRDEELGIQPLRRLGMHEGICGDGLSFDEGVPA
jgi:hypothetical protein